MFERIEQFLSAEREISPDGPIYVWLIGPYAAGKTTVGLKLKERLSSFGTIQHFSGDKHFKQLIAEDTDSRLHDGEIKPDGASTVVIKSSEFDDEVNRRLIQEIQDFKGDVCIIEKASGKDQLEIRDLSIKNFIRIIPQAVYARSVFVYLSCPYELRRQRNANRSGLGGGKDDLIQVNVSVFERFAREDDFEEWSKIIDRPLIVVDTST